MDSWGFLKTFQIYKSRISFSYSLRRKRYSELLIY